MEKGLRIAILTLGCKVNQSESAFIGGALRSQGHEVVDYDDNPDVCIINTCTVTSKADYQSRQFIRRAVRNGARVIATGCYAQTNPHEILNIDGIISIIGNSEKVNIIDALYKLLEQEGKAVNLPPVDATFFSGAYYSKRARAFLKIQDGCNNSCSYCVIPRARGKGKSMSPDEVLKEVGNLYSTGYREVVLTGVHIGSYGADLNPRTSLTEITKEIKRGYPELRIRLSSIEPDDLNDELLSMIKDNLICPHLHIPIQSGSDRILRRMNRCYNSMTIRELIKKVISLNPDISIGTDVIVGFPGEGEKEFEATYRLLEELPFSYIHVFPYSERPMTPAASLPDHVSPKIKKRRVNLVRELSTKKIIDYISRYKNRFLEVIIEEDKKTDGFYKGISSNYIRVLVKDNGSTPGAKMVVKGLSFDNGVLICEPVKQA